MKLFADSDSLGGSGQRARTILIARIDTATIMSGCFPPTTSHRSQESSSNQDDAPPPSPTDRTTEHPVSGELTRLQRRIFQDCLSDGKRQLGSIPRSGTWDSVRNEFEAKEADFHATHNEIAAAGGPFPTSRPLLPSHTAATTLFQHPDAEFSIHQHDDGQVTLGQHLKLRRPVHRAIKRLIGPMTGFKNSGVSASSSPASRSYT